jgi:hypothetical protein
LILNLAKKGALALTSDLFDVLLPLPYETKSDFLDFLGEANTALRVKTSKLAESSDMTSKKQFKRT